MAKTSVKKSDVAPIKMTMTAAENPAPMPVPGTMPETPAPMAVPAPMAIPEPVAIPTPMGVPEADGAPEPKADKTVEEEISEETPAADDSTPIEKELKEMIAKLRQNGLEPMEVMSHPDFASLSERAIATGMDEYAIFMMLNT